MTKVKRIHAVWLQGEGHLRSTKPQLAKNLEGWRTHFPGWELKVWSADDIRALMTDPRVLAAFNSLGCFAMQADLGRYVIVHALGGMYIDTDLECRRPFEHLLSDTAPSVVRNVRKTLPILTVLMEKTSNCWFYVPQAGSPVMHQLIQDSTAGVLASPKRAAMRRPPLSWVMTTTGPTLFWRVIWGGRHVHPINWIPMSVIDPLGSDFSPDTSFPHAYAVHVPEASWTHPVVDWVRVHGRNLGYQLPSIAMGLSITATCLMLVALVLIVVIAVV